DGGSQRVIIDTRYEFRRLLVAAVILNLFPVDFSSGRYIRFSCRIHIELRNGQRVILKDVPLIIHTVDIKEVQAFIIYTLSRRGIVIDVVLLFPKHILEYIVAHVLVDIPEESLRFIRRNIVSIHRCFQLLRIPRIDRFRNLLYFASEEYWPPISLNATNSTSSTA